MLSIWELKNNSECYLFCSSRITKERESYNVYNLSTNLHKDVFSAEFQKVLGRRTVCKVNAKEKGSITVDSDSSIEGDNYGGLTFFVTLFLYKPLKFTILIIESSPEEREVIQ
jgi:hypothetical protein